MSLAVVDQHGGAERSRCAHVNIEAEGQRLVLAQDHALDAKQVLKPAKKLRKLVKKLGRKQEPDKVHDLRTHTRRFEAIFEVVSTDGGGIRQLDIDQQVAFVLGGNETRGGRREAPPGQD